MLWITYNGEIYNFPELRRELAGKGHRFVSETRHRSRPASVRRGRAGCVKRLNGMFAFAICDIRSGTPSVFMARDHFGMKPFYYARQGKRFAFASEIKALLQVPGIDAELDPRSAASISDISVGARSRNHVSRDSETSCGTLRDRFARAKLKIERYWDLTFPPADAAFAAVGGGIGGRDSGAVSAFSGSPDDQ